MRPDIPSVYQKNPTLTRDPEKEKPARSARELKSDLSKTEATLNRVIYITAAIVIILLLAALYVRSFRDEVYDEIKIIPIDSSKNNTEILEGYHWIRVNALENSSDVQEYLHSEIRKALGENEDRDSKRIANFIDDIKLNFAELKSDEDIKSLNIKLQAYLKIRAQLKSAYEEALSISRLLSDNMKEYNFCREKVLLIKDNLISSSVDLERLKLEIYRFDAEIAEINNELEAQDKDKNLFVLETSNSLDKLKAELRSLQRDSKQYENIDEQIRMRISENDYFTKKLADYNSRKPTLVYSITAMKKNFKEFTDQLKLLLEKLNLIITNLDILRLEIKDLKLKSDISRQIVELGGSENITQQTRLTDTIRDRFSTISKLYHNSDKSQKNELAKNIKQDQAKYKEIMTNLNKLKKKAYIQKKENVLPLLRKNELEYENLLKEKESIEKQIKDLTRKKEEFNREIITKELELNNIIDDISRMEQKRTENAEFISKHKDFYDENVHNSTQIRERIQQNERKYEKFISDIDQKKRGFYYTKIDLQNKKADLEDYYKDKQRDLITILRGMNTVISQCKKKERAVAKVKLLSDQTYNEIQSLFESIAKIQKEIVELVQKIRAPGGSSLVY